MTDERRRVPVSPARPRGGGRAVATAVLVCAAVGAVGCTADGSAPGRARPSPVTPPATPPVTPPAAPSAGGARGADAVERLAVLEDERRARLGVFALDTGTGAVVAYRAGERFPHASTIKALIAGAVLQDVTPSGLTRRVQYTQRDLVAHSPVTELHVRDGLTVRELIDAAVTVSDNTASNLLLDLLGGPAALDAALAQDAGDHVT